MNRSRGSFYRQGEPGSVVEQPVDVGSADVRGGDVAQAGDAAAQVVDVPVQRGEIGAVVAVAPVPCTRRNGSRCCAGANMAGSGVSVRRVGVCGPTLESGQARPASAVVPIPPEHADGNNHPRGRRCGAGAGSAGPPRAAVDRRRRRVRRGRREPARWTSTTWTVSPRRWTSSAAVTTPSRCCSGSTRPGSPPARSGGLAECLLALSRPGVQRGVRPGRGLDRACHPADRGTRRTVPQQGYLLLPAAERELRDGDYQAAFATAETRRRAGRAVRRPGRRHRRRAPAGAGPGRRGPDQRGPGAARRGDAGHQRRRDVLPGHRVDLLQDDPDLPPGVRRAPGPRVDRRAQRVVRCPAAVHRRLLRDLPHPSLRAVAVDRRLARGGRRRPGWRAGS